MSRGEPSAPLNFNRFFEKQRRELLSAAVCAAQLPTELRTDAGVLPTYHAHDEDAAHPKCVLLP